jgi:carboxypeptidase PM20D1
MRRLLGGLALLLAALAAVLALNVARLPAPAAAPPRQEVALDAGALAARLAAALAIPTVSSAGGGNELAPFQALHALLAEQFPLTHATLQREVVAGASLLYRWEGRADCPALLLLAHQDVVPVEPGTEARWTHPPFAGVVADGAIWGRGAIDNKGGLLAILEAVEHLVQQGWKPPCPVYLAFGHDEEVGGGGARAMAALLRERGVEVAGVLDEGGAITDGAIPGTPLPLATIGVAEKGYVSVRLRVAGGGGHSSMPPPQTAIGRLAAAVARLEATRPAVHFSPVQRELLRRLAPHVPLSQRVVLANLWLFAPLVARQLAATPAGDATLRTTTAPTLFHAGVKDNVLAQQAEAVVNFRIRPGDSVSGVLAHVETVVDDPAVEQTVVGDFATEPTAPASWEDPLFLAIEDALRAVSPEPALIVAPYVTSGATDARHYAPLTPRLFRFLPVRLSPELLASFHGNNERLPVAEYLRMVRFYLALLRGWTPPGAAPPSA